MAITLMFALAIAVILLPSAVLRYWQSPLRRYPGPWAATFTDLWRLFIVWAGNADATQRDLHKQYGAVVRIGPKCLSLCDPSLIKTIYSTRNPFRKSDFYSAADTVSQGEKVQTQFTTRNEQWHDYLVRPIRGAYSLSSVVQFETLIDQALDHFMQKLDNDYASSRKQCDIGELLNHFAWDVIGEITFSERLGALDGNKEILQLLSNGQKAIRYLSIIGQMPILDGILKNPVFSVGPPGFKIAADWASSKLLARLNKTDRERSKSQRDFADVFIDAEKDENCSDAQMTPRQISWLVINTVAGSDTVGATLQAAVYYVCRHPTVKDRLVMELNVAMGKAEQAHLP